MSAILLRLLRSLSLGYKWLTGEAEQYDKLMTSIVVIHISAPERAVFHGISNGTPAAAMVDPLKNLL
jgi:hypothetical protein